jgi:2,4-dienoyl-CoA reductase-like NADH-dependent reductase (Old Yellow Enzyme family)
MTATHTTTTVLAEPLTLPCGLVLPNRILKGAMGEGLANPWTADVTPELIRLYERWADGGTGTLITGVICVQRRAENSVTVALDDRTDTDALRRWATAVHRRDVRLLGQIQHPGRQVPVYMARHPLAPSALPPVRGSRLFGSSRPMTTDEIVDMVEKFATAAAMLEQAGFDGVELHAAHGYLIGQFLSPETNLRTDDWGGDLERRARFLIEIIRAVRSRVDPGFAVAVKINSSDFRPGGFDIDDSAHVVGMLGAEGVDLIEISGGTFESYSGCLGVQPGAPGTSKEAYFAGMAPRLRAMTDVPLALTGGLRSREVMERLLEQGTVDMIGLGRPLIQQPDLSAHLLDGTADGIDLQPCPERGLNELFWWLNQFRRLADGKDFDPDYTPRHNQLDTMTGMLRQIAANLRATALHPLAWRP